MAPSFREWNSVLFIFFAIIILAALKRRISSSPWCTLFMGMDDICRISLMHSDWSAHCSWKCYSCFLRLEEECQPYDCSQLCSFRMRMWMFAFSLAMSSLMFFVFRLSSCSYKRSILLFLKFVSPIFINIFMRYTNPFSYGKPISATSRHFSYVCENAIPKSVR